VAVEVDQERGQKRSSRDASLPERAEGGSQGPEAILVDAEGNAAAASSSDAQTDQPKQESSVSSDTATVEAAAESKVGNSGGKQPVSSKGESEDDKAESRKAFAVLVRETCSSRSYPY
jgi:hypothetical protein